jgi:hypothetical protein
VLLQTLNYLPIIDLGNNERQGYFGGRWKVTLQAIQASGSRPAAATDNGCGIRPLPLHGAMRLIRLTVRALRPGKVAM